MEYQFIKGIGREIAENLFNNGKFEPKNEFTPYYDLTDIVSGWIDYKELDEDVSEEDIYTIRKCFIVYFNELLKTKTNYKTELYNYDNNTYLRIWKDTEI